MKKTLMIGTQREYMQHGEGNVRFFVFVKYKNDHLSITGVVGPTKDGKCWGSCGQCVPDPKLVTPAEGWTTDMVAKLAQVWDKWHLNDMRAGSPAQHAWLEANPVEWEYPQSHYEVARDALTAVGLNPDPNHLVGDKPYKYGSSWLFEAVPADVITWLESLPDATIAPPGPWANY